MSNNLDFKAKLIAALALTVATAIMTVFPALVAYSGSAEDVAPAQIDGDASAGQPKLQDRVQTEAGEALRSIVFPGVIGNSTVVVRVVVSP